MALLDFLSRKPVLANKLEKIIKLIPKDESAFRDSLSKQRELLISELQESKKHKGEKEERIMLEIFRAKIVATILNNYLDSLDQDVKEKVEEIWFK